MKFIVASALSLLPTILAAPTTSLISRAVEPAADALAKRADLGVYLCTDRNWKGHCVHIPSAASVCVPLASDLNDLVSSAGPDQGSLCYFFVNPNCDANADFIHLDYPGVADLSKTPVNGPAGSTRNFEDKISSYFCVPA